MSEALEDYNSHRIHLVIGYMVPDEFELDHDSVRIRQA